MQRAVWMATLMAMYATACGGDDGAGGDFPFGGGSGGDDDGNGIHIPDAPGSGKPPTGGKRVFVTSTTYTGDLATAAGTAVSSANAGVVSANKLCQTAAAAGALGGTWKAIVQQPGGGLDAMGDVGPWYRLDGTLVFNNRAQLKTTPLASITIDELGHQQYSSSFCVWTGLQTGGAPLPGCALGSYGVWTYGNSAQNGVVGNLIADDSRWIYDGDTSCNTPCHLYCLEQ